MSTTSPILLWCLGPIVAAILPFLWGATRPGRILQRILGGNRAGFYPVPLAEAPGRECGAESSRPLRGRTVAGLTLAAVVVAVQVFFGVAPHAVTETPQAWAASVAVGLGGGLFLLGIFVATRAARTALAAARQLTRLGVAGVWDQDAESSAPFREALVDQVARERTLDAVGGDGLAVLELLADPTVRSLEAPHPRLRGAKIRLLLVPPRSLRRDPESRGLSCAEEALARLGRSPEEHWRRINRALETRHQWVKNHEVSLEIRFLEERPAFAKLIFGSRAWYRAWESEGAGWLEVCDHRDHPMAGALRDQFVGAWGSASRELPYSLSAGPSGSTFLRKSALHGLKLQLAE